MTRLTHAKIGRFVIASLLLGAPLLASAQALRPDIQFHQIFLTEAQSLNPTLNVSLLAHLHLIADAPLVQALSADTVRTALAQSAPSNLTTLVQATDLIVPPPASRSTLNSRPLTLVVVPGLFAEFNREPSFGEILTRPSRLRQELHNSVMEKGVVDRVALLSLYQENLPDENISAERPLDQLVLTGETTLSDGQVVRVVSFAMETLSLESLGEIKAEAKLLNRRLEKYLELTGPQDLAFVGYSRGAAVALEMLTQAQVQERPWLHDVQGMVSLGGLIAGTTLIDDTLYNPTSPESLLLTYLNKTVGVLELTDPFLPEERQLKVVQKNSLLWHQFADEAVHRLTEKGPSGRPWVDAYFKFKAVKGVDPGAPMAILSNLWSDLKLDQLSSDYNFNLIRFRYFLGRLLDSTRDLSSGVREHWWVTHDLPKNVTYYSLAAAMADRDANPVEAALFDNPLAYGQGSFDDATMMLNHLTYMLRSSGGTLDDGQVSVAQASFLPQAIAKLNDKNQGLSTKFLGVLSTHHWGLGVALANSIPGGVENHFPREAVLRALAVQVKLDHP